MIGFLSADFNVAADVRRTFLVLRRVERGQADFDASNARKLRYSGRVSTARLRMVRRLTLARNDTIFLFQTQFFPKQEIFC
jgi:hypothetical protein